MNEFINATNEELMGWVERGQVTVKTNSGTVGRLKGHVTGDTSMWVIDAPSKRGNLYRTRDEFQITGVDLD